MTERVHKLPRVERFGDRAVDASRYTDQSFLRLEVERIFKRGWIAVGPVVRVETPGSVAVLNESGLDVVVTRDQSGQLHGFRNRCMHRGSRLVHRCGQSDDIVCTYHGWRYGLDGALEHVPGDTGFGAVDVSRMRLQAVRVAEGAGLVWVCLDEQTPDFEEYLSGIVGELEPYALHEMVPIQDKVFSIPVNWKLMLENAFDYYHVPQVHRSTIYAHVDDQPELALYGDHIRQNLHIAPYRWRRFIDGRCSRAGPYSDKQLSRLHKYTLFPNTMINVLPYHLTVMRFWPDGVGNVRLHYTFCQRRGARGLEWLRAHGTWIASRLILLEDVRMLLRCQRGMDSETVPQHLLHDFEAASMHFHEVIGRWIDA